MSWNYRILRQEVGTETIFAIHEVHYDDDGTPHSCTVNAAIPIGETLNELRRAVGLYTQALSKPVLEYAMFERGRDEN